MTYKSESKSPEVQEPDFSGTYTAADYVNWKFEQLVELVHGKIFRMNAPVTNHQLVLKRVLNMVDPHQTSWKFMKSMALRNTG
ncbi:MAG: hypothetical protein WD077_04860 [Bacteroidia bacterium]